MTSLPTGHEATAALSFLWLEITGKCQLRCVRCYAESGPQGTHGIMKTDDWRRVIDEAATLGAHMVQLIGGEPTLHPALPGLVSHVLSRGMIVEVFSNLVRVSPYLWSVFSQPGVRLATSYYADQDRNHEAVTGRRGSYTRTMTNIAEAVRRSIPLRVGLIGVLDGQRVEQARQQLETLGCHRSRNVHQKPRDVAPKLNVNRRTIRASHIAHQATIPNRNAAGPTIIRSGSGERFR